MWFLKVTEYDSFTTRLDISWNEDVIIFMYVDSRIHHRGWLSFHGVWR
jgi:hypothetical protein